MPFEFRLYIHLITREPDILNLFLIFSLETIEYFKCSLWRKLYLEINGFHAQLQVSKKEKRQQ